MPKRERDGSGSRSSPRGISLSRLFHHDVVSLKDVVHLSDRTLHPMAINER